MRLLCLLTLLTTLAWTQQQPPDPTLYRVTGIVVNSVTGEPISRALVSIPVPLLDPRTAQPDPSGARRTPAMLTDANGRFTLDQIPAGNYFVSVKKPGFLSDRELHDRSDERQRVTIPAQSALRLTLTPAPVVTGHVTGTDGRPLDGLGVQVLHSSIVNGRRRWVPSVGSQTDADGDFRATFLRPGLHIIRFGPRYREPMFESPDSHTGIAIEYWPNARTESAAGIIDLHAGEEFVANITLREQRLLHIEGDLGSLPEGVFSTDCRALNEDRDDVGTNRGMRQGEGRFSLGVLGAGTYTIQCRGFSTKGDQWVAQQKIQIDRDVAGMRLALAPLVPLPVTYSLENVSARSDTIQIGGPPSFVLRSLDTESELLSSRTAPVRGASEPTLSFASVEPGVYRFDLAAFGTYYLASATFRGRDVLHNALTIEPGETGAFEAVLRSDGAHIKLDLGNDPPTLREIVIVDDAGSSPTRHIIDQGEARPELTLPPGSYTLYVFGGDLAKNVEYANPKVLERYSGKSFSVSPGETRSVEAHVNSEER